MIGTIVLGLVGFGIVVFVHELGHFIAAKLVGVDVEAFSLGWGPRLIGFKRGGTDYRLSLLPVGGFCSMKGEDAFRKALEANETQIKAEPRTFYGVSPWRRIVISLAGPISNLLFACVVFSIVYFVGVRFFSPDARILLASEYASLSETATEYPADVSGMQNGDLILAIDDSPIRNFTELQEKVALNAGKTLRFKIDRSGQELNLNVTPKLDKKGGVGRIGVYPWVEPIVDKVTEGSPAAFADIRPGDILLMVDNQPIRHSLDIEKRILVDTNSLALALRRGEQTLTKTVIFHNKAKNTNALGIQYKSKSYVDREQCIAASISRGIFETAKTFSLTLKGLTLLFSGIDMLSAISGPARITYMVGEVASQGFSGGIRNGLTIAFNFLSFLSIGLFIMNLLPIPMLDGGQILLFVIETVRKKPFRVRTIYRYQYIGLIIVLGLFALSTIADIHFFSGK